MVMIYGVPGEVGGAATKIRDLIKLLAPHVPGIVLIVPDKGWSQNSFVKRLVNNYSMQVRYLAEVTSCATGVVLAICETAFFASGAAERLKSKGHRVVWSNDMMWEFKGEREAVRRGIVDRVIFVSEGQRQVFSELYSEVEQRMIPNFVDPTGFPYTDRQNPVFTIGRLSRPDPVKYPIDFPVFYEKLGIEDVRYRVQAWSDDLRKVYNWHQFGPEWDLLPSNKVSAVEFLSSLDLFIYPLGHRVKESWGRSTVEAMLTGCVPLVPRGHNFEQMIVHGESGFICEGFSEYRMVARRLYASRSLRERIGRQAAMHARLALCNEDDHRRRWSEALSFQSL
jgi:hypothetical protein